MTNIFNGESRTHEDLYILHTLEGKGYEQDCFILRMFVFDRAYLGSSTIKWDFARVNCNYVGGAHPASLSPRVTRQIIKRTRPQQYDFVQVGPFAAELL